jgi:large subunit ribosomal protein L21
MNDAAEYAVVSSGGNQVRVTAGETLRMEKLSGDPGAEIVFPNVLLLASGGAVEVGRPFVAGASVKAMIVKHGRGKKLRIYRFKRKKGWQRTLGHRQDFTLVRVTEIVRG